MQEEDRYTCDDEEAIRRNLNDRMIDEWVRTGGITPSRRLDVERWKVVRIKNRLRCGG